MRHPQGSIFLLTVCLCAGTDNIYQADDGNSYLNKNKATSKIQIWRFRVIRSRRLSETRIKILLQFHYKHGNKKKSSVVLLTHIFPIFLIFHLPISAASQVRSITYYLFPTQQNLQAVQSETEKQSRKWVAGICWYQH